jgi:tetratricopeptide (TPR) repeat protein
VIEAFGKLVRAYDAALDATEPRRALLRLRRSADHFCETHEDWPRARLLTARVNADLEHYEEARKQADDLLSSWPPSPDVERSDLRAEALTLLGQIAAEEGLLWQAAHWFEEAIAEAQQGSSDTLELAYDGLVTVFRELQRFDEAQGALKRGVSQLQGRGASHTALDGQARLLEGTSSSMPALTVDADLVSV